jgi:hypothetical protein
MARRKADAYQNWLQTEFGSLIDQLELEPLQKRYLTSRWLDQLTWLEKKAGNARTWYYRLRLITIVGAVIVPALVVLGDSATYATAVLSIVVAASAAIEQFFRFGDRWHHYRATSERMKAEGWLFAELTGAYSANGASHQAAFPAFANRIEELIKSDVEVYLTKVAVEKSKQAEPPPDEDEV